MTYIRTVNDDRFTASQFTEGRTMPQNTSLRARFTDGALATTSAPKVVNLAYERLARDLTGAIEAIEVSDTPRAHELLVHAQDLVHELCCMLDLDVWEHAASLAAIYQYIIRILTVANTHKRVAEVREAKLLLAELGDAFRQASVEVAASASHLGPARDFSVRV
jgi:flagellar secretion chaperone FliS